MLPGIDNQRRQRWNQNRHLQSRLKKKSLVFTGSYTQHGKILAYIWLLTVNSLNKSFPLTGNY